MDFKKIRNKLFKVRMAATAGAIGLACTIGRSVAYATTIDMTVITDMIPVIVSIMAVSMVVGVLKRLGKI